MVIINKLKSISKIQILAIILIVIGLGLVIRYGIGAFNAYRALEYARLNNFAAGNPDPDLIRPWMNIRYIAVAYTVPQEFIFAQLGLPINRSNGEMPLYRLNDQMGLGPSDQGKYPAIIDKLREAILKYRENPVTTGLEGRGVAPWMSIQYIANSTGVPAEYIFEQIGVPGDGNAYITLEGISDRVHYQGGPRKLAEDIQKVVDTYEAKP